MKKFAKILSGIGFISFICVVSMKTTKAPNVPVLYSSTIGTFPDGKVYLFTYEKSKYIVFSNGNSVAVVKHE